MSSQPSVTVGIDLGDRHSHLCLLDTGCGEIVEESRIPTTPKGFERRFSGREPMRIAVEAGTHSPWISRLLEGCGHEVLVANARKLRLIYAEGKKNDRLDAENLARLARLDPRLLSPLKHRGEASQAHLALVRSREALAGARTKLVNHVRGAVKSFGARLSGCSAKSFHIKAREGLPEVLVPALGPILETIGSLTDRIREYDRAQERGLARVLPRDRAPAASPWGRSADRARLRADPGGPYAVRDQPQRGSLRRAGPRHPPVRRARSPEANLQARRRDAKEAPGELRPPRAGPVRQRLRPPSTRREARRARRQERQEAGRGGRGEEALRAAAPPLDYG